MRIVPLSEAASPTGALSNGDEGRQKKGQKEQPSERQTALLIAEEKIAAIKAAKEEKAKLLAAQKARETEIDDAGRAAAQQAAKAPVKQVAEVEEMKQARIAKREQLTAVLNEIKTEREQSLKVQVGEAMIRRGTNAFELMKQWDTNGDGELDKLEFRTAVRTTLKIKASNDKLDALFASLDENGDGVLSIKTEIRPAIKNIHIFCKAEHEREERARSEVDTCTKQMNALDECKKAASKLEAISTQLKAVQASRPLDVRLAAIIDSKLSGDAEVGPITEWEICLLMGAGGDGLVTKERFLRSISEKRSELGFEREKLDEVRDLMSSLFDGAAKLEKASGEEFEMKMDVRTMLKGLATAFAAHTAQEEKLVASEKRAMERARALQVQYAERAARFDKELEWSTQQARERVDKGGKT